MHITRLMKDFKVAGRLSKRIIVYSTAFITHCRNAAFMVTKFEPGEVQMARLPCQTLLVLSFLPV